MGRVELIQDWHRCWRWLSVQFVALASVVQIALLSFPDALRAYLPESWLHTITIGLLVAAVVGRLVDQDKKAEK